MTPTILIQIRLTWHAVRDGLAAIGCYKATQNGAEGWGRVQRHLRQRVERVEHLDGHQHRQAERARLGLALPEVPARLAKAHRLPACRVGARLHAQTQVAFLSTKTRPKLSKVPL